MDRCCSSDPSNDSKTIEMDDGGHGHVVKEPTRNMIEGAESSSDSESISSCKSGSMSPIPSIEQSATHFLSPSFSHHAPEMSSTTALSPISAASPDQRSRTTKVSFDQSASPPLTPSRAPPFTTPSQSQQEMYDSEHIDVLVDLVGMELSESVRAILGDPKSYNIPTQQAARDQIERDLRKIKVSLFEYQLEEPPQRKYAKSCILKHHDLLNSIFKRYCKIGRDTQWMTMFGWISLLRDCGLVHTQSDEHQYSDLFKRVYQYHSQNLHSARRDQRHTRHSIKLSAMYGNDLLRDKGDWQPTCGEFKLSGTLGIYRSFWRLLISLLFPE